MARALSTYGGLIRKAVSEFDLAALGGYPLLTTDKNQSVVHLNTFVLQSQNIAFPAIINKRPRRFCFSFFLSFFLLTPTVKKQRPLVS
jgi:hypothetical protein